MYHSLLAPDVKQMVDEGDELGLREFGEALYSGVAAEIIAELSIEDAWTVLSRCEIPRRAEIFCFLPITTQVELVALMDKKQLSLLIEQMAADDRVDLLERMGPEEVEAILPLVAQAERTDIRRLLSYPEDSTGAILTTEYATLPQGLTVREALEKLRLQAPNRETIYYVYVVDQDRHLIGFVSLRKLILSKPEMKIADIMATDVISVPVDSDQEHAANELLRYDFIAIPVVDADNRIVGIVTHDDAADVLRDEAVEDQHRLAAIEPLEDTYLSTPIPILARKRGVWLLFLLFAALLTAAVLRWFEGGSDNGWILMFLPLVLASGGNAGSQSAALVISALAREQESIGGGMVRRILYRESLLGLLLGGTVAVLSYVFAVMLLGVHAPALVVGVTVFLVIMMAATAGAALPIIFYMMDADPAYMSTPLIAALVDVFGVIIYFNIARVVTTG